MNATVANTVQAVSTIILKLDMKALGLRLYVNERQLMGMLRFLFLGFCFMNHAPAA